MVLSLRELCQRLTLALPPSACPDQEIHGVSSLGSAGAGHVAFCDDARYLEALTQTQAGVVLVTESLKASVPQAAVGLSCSDPRRLHAEVAAWFVKRLQPRVALGVHPAAVVGEGVVVPPSASVGAGATIESGAVLGEGVEIGAGCFVGEGVVLGARTCLHPRVTLYPGVQVGEDCTLSAGVVIGCQGFGHVKTDEGWQAIPHTGGVVLGCGVSVGANTTIDAGTHEPTVIGDGVKLDNLIQIAHNVNIGSHTAIAACVGVAGSARIGSWCMIGGGCMLAGHIQIVDGVVITGDSSVTQSILEPGVYSGSGVIQPNRQWRKSMVRLTQLDQWIRRLKALEKQGE